MGCEPTANPSLKYPFATLPGRSDRNKTPLAGISFERPEIGLSVPAELFLKL